MIARMQDRGLLAGFPDEEGFRGRRVRTLYCVACIEFASLQGSQKGFATKRGFKRQGSTTTTELQIPLLQMPSGKPGISWRRFEGCMLLELSGCELRSVECILLYPSL